MDKWMKMRSEWLIRTAHSSFLTIKKKYSYMRVKWGNMKVSIDKHNTKEEALKFERV